MPLRCGIQPRKPGLLSPVILFTAATIQLHFYFPTDACCPPAEITVVLLRKSTHRHTCSRGRDRRLRPLQRLSIMVRPFLWELPMGRSITKATLIRLASVTHTNNMGQRINRLSFSIDARWAEHHSACERQPVPARVLHAVCFERKRRAFRS